MALKKTDNSPRFGLVFEPSGISCRVAEGVTIIQAASDHHIPIRSDCGGKGRCGKCLVTAHPADRLSPPSEAEMKVLSKEQLAAGVRLACQARVFGPLTTTVPDICLDDQVVVGKTDIDGKYPVSPMVERLVLPAARISDRDGQSHPDIATFLKAQAKTSAGKSIEFQDPWAIQALSQPFIFNNDLTLVSHQQRGVTAILKGERTRSLGVALDIGTTTLAGYLCDLRSGTVLASAGSANPQRRYGEDVISRIAYANEHEGGTQILQELVVGEVNALIGRCLENVGASRDDVDEVAVVGNTTMLQLFAGLHPHSLGFSPYPPICRTLVDLRAVELGLDLNPGTNIHILPMISGFIGGDTMGAIIAERPHEQEHLCLIVDIGTNGELVLGNKDGLWVTSCATGPALEGAHISCGMRAVPGAIHKVEIAPSTRQVHIEVLGGADGARPAGICGSGIIDAAAGMRRAGLVLPNGRIKEGMPGVLSDERGIGRRFVLVPAEKSAAGRDISVTLEDIRQIQLAKGALSVGIQFLMRASGVSHIDRIILTGAFGARFNWENAVTIGMLPKSSTFNEVRVVENAAGFGAIMGLLDKRRREEAQNLLSGIRVLELAEEPDFAVAFPMAMTFPPVVGEKE
jgi:uncharacterized 2Fe-2S/4Fe-4S cluster protein (DUF4445 family)